MRIIALVVVGVALLFSGITTAEAQGYYGYRDYTPPRAHVDIYTRHGHFRYQSPAARHRYYRPPVYHSQTRRIAVYCRDYYGYRYVCGHTYVRGSGW